MAEAERTSDPPLQTLTLPDGPLTYVDEGPRGAPALLAVHGIPGSVRDFRYLAPQLTDQVRFVRIDLPGFGGSAPVADAIEDLGGRARVVLALADHLGLPDFAVLGHSMGGGTAFVLASEHRARVSHLALVASVGLSLHRGLGMRPRLFRLTAAGLSLPALGPLLTHLTRAQYRKRRFPGADEMDVPTLALQLRSLGATDFGRIRRAASGPLPPTLLAFSRDDHMVESWISEELARALPAARRLAFDDGGHNIQKTRAVEIASALRGLLGLGANG